MDLYEELIEEKEADSNATKAENASLKAEVAKLKEDNKNLWIINTDLSEKLKRASTNITALIKTCRAELNRKNRTITSLRNEVFPFHQVGY